MNDPVAPHRCEPLAEDALLVVLGEEMGPETARCVRAFTRAAEILAPACEIVPAFASVALIGNATPALAEEILAATDQVGLAPENGRAVQIPVCYGGEFGPDLEDIARRAGLPPDEVIARHTGAEYEVDALGFAPGFPYLRGLDPRLTLPRRATPRTSIPAGSVGIGGAQTGVYPLVSPGGWHLLGRTPRRLFQPENEAAPTLLRPGDRVRFVAVTPEEFERVAAAEAPLPRPAAAGARDILVRRAGMFTTLQTLVPRRWRQLGIAGGGAADARSLAVANALVGNAPAAAALELTLAGPELVFARDATVALAGGEFDAWRNGVPFPLLRPERIAAGDVLRIGAARRGARAYLAADGGFAAETVLGSAATDVRAGLGGLAGRALRDGDFLTLLAPDRASVPLSGWRASRSFLPSAGGATLRVLAGLQAQEFNGQLEGREFTVSPASDRMGVRLAGEPLRRRAGAPELLSAAVLPGTVQVPPDGLPIVLGVEAGTIGGYPRVAQVIAADLPLIGQLRPSEGVRFRWVTLGEAEAARREADRSLALLRWAAMAKLGG